MFRRLEWEAVDEAAGQPILAIDLGGTQIRAAHVSPDRRIACRRAVPTEDREGVDSVVARLCELARSVRADAHGGRAPA